MAEAVFKSIEPTSEEIAEAIRQLSVTDIERYSVKWEAEGRKHNTRYDVTHISYRRERPPTMQIVGGRGGKYLIDPNIDDAPMIRYLNPNGSEQEFWLLSLVILEEGFAWDTEG